MIRVKICGIRTPADACVAAEAGADFIGMVFVPERHRRISHDAARGIVDSVRGLEGPLRSGSGQALPQMVGLFADQPVEEVNETVARCDLDAVQLCGRESIDYTAAVDCQVIKVVHVAASYRAPDDVPQLSERVQEYADAGCLVTLDRLVEGIQGGTGQSFNLDMAASMAHRGGSFILAGGLTPANVGRIISVVRPWGVDVSSGVETIGKKDRRKIQRFISNARDADAALTGLV